MSKALDVALWLGCSAVCFFLIRSRMPAHRAAVAMRRPSSFSFVIFRNDVTQEIPRLLEACHYKLLGKSSMRTVLGDVYASLPEPSGPRNSTVAKAYCKLGDYTILCGPEMVFLTFMDELAQFCKVNLTQAVIAVWERFSETVALSEVSAAGLTRQTFYIAGKARGEQKQPHRTIQDRPDSEGLHRALTELGILPSVLDGEVEATVLKLQE
jgi:hypothetical protein